MKEVVIIVLRNLFLSAVCGTLIWFLAHFMLLPVTDVDDGYGHGPDAGTVEWNNVIQGKTEAYQRKAKENGVIGGVLAFVALTLVSVQGNRCLRRL